MRKKPRRIAKIVCITMRDDVKTAASAEAASRGLSLSGLIQQLIVGATAPHDCPKTET